MAAVLVAGALIGRNGWDVLPEEQEGFLVLPKEHPDDCANAVRRELEIFRKLSVRTGLIYSC